MPILAAPQTPFFPVEIPSVPVGRQIRSMDQDEVPTCHDAGAKKSAGGSASAMADPSSLAVPQGLQGYILAAHHPPTLELMTPMLTPQPRPVSPAMRKQLLEKFDLHKLISTLPSAPSPPMLSSKIELDHSSRLVGQLHIQDTTILH